MLWVRLKLPFRLNHVNIYLLADGDGWAMVDSGFGNEETIAAWTALFEGPLGACEDHPADRDPFASRSCRPGGMDRRALRLPALHVAGGISAVGLSPEPRHRGTPQRAAAVLPASRHGREPDRQAARPRPGLSEAGLDPAAVLSPHLAWRRDLDRHAALQGHHRRRPCARPGDAVLRRRQAVPVGRSGAEQDLAQCQRMGGRARSELARRISGLTGEPHHHAAL